MTEIIKNTNIARSSVPDIQSLTAKIDVLQKSFDFWTAGNIWLIALTVILASIVFFTQFMSVKKGKELAKAQSELLKAKDMLLSVDLQNKDVEIGKAQAVASKAKAAAADANQKAATIEKDNIKLQTVLEQERKDRLQLEAKIAPRRLTPEMQTTIASSLKSFSGRTVIVKSYTGDAESAILGKQIIASLKAANIIVADHLLTDTVYNSVSLGIHVTGPDREFAAHLIDRFSSIGHLLVSDEPQSGTIITVQKPVVNNVAATILVGAKPINE